MKKARRLRRPQEKILEEAGRIKALLQELRALCRKGPDSRDVTLFRLKSFVCIKGRGESSSTAASSTPRSEASGFETESAVRPDADTPPTGSGQDFARGG